MLRSLSFIAALLPAPALAQAVDCSHGVGFNYMPADPEDEMLWFEVFAPQLVRTENTRDAVFGDQLITVNIFVVMIEEDEPAADLINFNIAEDGILVGDQWMSLDAFEAYYYQLLCQ